MAVVGCSSNIFPLAVQLTKVPRAISKSRVPTELETSKVVAERRILRSRTGEVVSRGSGAGEEGSLCCDHAISWDASAQLVADLRRRDTVRKVSSILTCAKIESGRENSACCLALTSGRLRFPESNTVALISLVCGTLQCKGKTHTFCRTSQLCKLLPDGSNQQRRTRSL